MTKDPYYFMRASRFCISTPKANLSWSLRLYLDHFPNVRSSAGRLPLLEYWAANVVLEDNVLILRCLTIPSPFSASTRKDFIPSLSLTGKRLLNYDNARYAHTYARLPATSARSGTAKSFLG